MSDHDPTRNLDFEPRHEPQSVFDIDNNPTPTPAKTNETEDDHPGSVHKTLHNGTLLVIGIFHGFLFVFWVLPASSYAAFKATDLVVNGPGNLLPPHEDNLFIPSVAAIMNFLLVLTLLPNYRWIENRKM